MMKFNLRLFMAALSERLGNFRVWVIFLLLPVLCFAATRLVPEEEISAPVTVGVALPEEGGEVFQANLSEMSGTVVSYEFADEDTVRGKVSTGKWDCGLILPEEYAEKIKEADTTRIVTLVISSGSTVYPIVQENVTACLAREAAPYIAAEYLIKEEIIAPDETDEYIGTLSEQLSDENRIHIQMQTVDGEALDAIETSGTGYDNIIRGTAAILLLVWVLFIAMDLGRWYDTAFAKRLAPLRGKTELLFPHAVAAMAFPLVSGAAAMCFLPNPGKAVTALSPYMLFLGAVALLFAKHRGLWSALPALMPFVPVGGFLLSPVIIDVSDYIPALSGVSAYMPLTLFLKGASGDAASSLILLDGAAVLTVLLFLFDMTAGKRL